MLRRVLLLDNFDSFTHNVRHGLVEAGAQVQVVRCDEIQSAAELDREADLLVISPGPGHPQDASLSLEAIRTLGPRVPILGICLGHQCMALAFGGQVGRAPEPVHGKTALVNHDGRGLFQGIENPMTVARYHSLVVTDIPPDLEACAWSEDGLIMGLRHRQLLMAGVQFHPDSFLCPSGLEIFRHALRGCF